MGTRVAPPPWSAAGIANLKLPLNFFFFSPYTAPVACLFSPPVLFFFLPCARAWLSLFSKCHECWRSDLFFDEGYLPRTRQSRTSLSGQAWVFDLGHQGLLHFVRNQSQVGSPVRQPGLKPSQYNKRPWRDPVGHPRKP